jgi:CBS domain-containing protein
VFDLSQISSDRRNHNLVIYYQQSQAMNQSALQVKDIMSTQVVTVQRNEKLALADYVMKERAIRHLPVLDEAERVCGILSQCDLFRGALMRNLGYGGYLEQKMLDSMVAKEAMSRDVITTTATTPLIEAANTMIEHKIGCLPVIRDDELIGILTEEDFVRWVATANVPV